MAENSRESDDIQKAETQGQKYSKRFIEYLGSFFLTKNNEDQTSGKTGQKEAKTKPLWLAAIQFLVSSCVMAAKNMNFVEEDQVEQVVWFMYHIDPECYIKTVLVFFERISNLPMTPLLVPEMAANFGAHEIGSYLTIESKLYLELLLVLLATLSLGLFLILCRWIWSEIHEMITNGVILDTARLFSRVRNTLVILGFIAAFVAFFWREMKKALEMFEPNDIFGTDVKISWFCEVVMQEQYTTVSLLVITTIFTLYVMSWKEPASRFHKELLSMFRYKCVNMLYMHCIGRGFDRWSWLALGVVFIWCCAMFVAMPKGDWKVSRILPLIPCFVSLKLGTKLFGVTLMVGLVRAVMSVNSVANEGNKKHARVLRELWFTEFLLSLQP